MFTIPNQEDWSRLSTTTEDFYDEIEPLPEQPQDGLGDAIGGILDQVFKHTKCTSTSSEEKLKSRMESAFRRFVSLAHVVRPAAISHDGVSGRRLAEALGITPAGFSKLAVDWSDFLGGMRNPAQKSREARKSYSRAGGSGIGSSLPKRLPGHIGDSNYREDALAAQDQRAITEALGKLVASEVANIAARMAQRAAGKQLEPVLHVTWDRRERTVLRAHGLIQSGSDELTDAGRERVTQLSQVADSQCTTPNKESPVNHS